MCMQSNKKLLMALLAAPMLVFAQAGPGAMGPHAGMVEDLLILDSKIAMEKMSSLSAKLAPPPVAANAPAAPVAAAPERIEVLSVMGIGGNKKATLTIDGKRFSQLGEGSKAGKYLVKSVGGGCVDLVVAGKPSAKAGRKAGKQAVKHVCFDPDAEVEQQMPAVGGGAYAGQGGGGGIQTRMTIAPLPLPVVPAPMPIRVNPQ